MIYIGIDWSKDHHDMCIMNESGAVVSQIKYKQSLKGYQRMEAECQKLGVPPRQCIVAIETTYNLMVDFLVERGYIVYIIPPQATDGYRNRKQVVYTTRWEFQNRARQPGSLRDLVRKPPLLRVSAPDLAHLC